MRGMRESENPGFAVVIAEIPRAAELTKELQQRRKGNL
jgi:hypothetical protein